MRIFLLIIVLFALAGLAALMQPKEQQAQDVVLRDILMKEQKLSVEIADTIQKQGQGLSGRPSMKENEGMLFVFQESAPRSFWMKDMRFPIDIIWINAEGVIVGIAPEVSPETFPRTFQSPLPVPYVLELSAGWVQSHGVLVGDRISF